MAMVEKAHFCRVVLVVDLVGLPVSQMKSLHPAKGQLHSLQVKAYILQVLTEARETVFHILQVPMEVQEIVFHILQVPMEGREIVYHILQVQMEGREIVYHILQVQMAALVKVAFHSLGPMDSFHIQQAHLEHRTAQDDLLEDSRWHIQVVALALAHIHAPSCQRLLRLPLHPLVFLPFHWQVHIHLC